MKDRNGVELKVGDVCVDYWSGNKKNRGCICEITGLNCDTVDVVYDEHEDILAFQFPDELEIIGDVR